MTLTASRSANPNRNFQTRPKEITRNEIILEIFFNTGKKQNGI